MKKKKKMFMLKVLKESKLIDNFIHNCMSAFNYNTLSPDSTYSTRFK